VAFPECGFDMVMVGSYKSKENIKYRKYRSFVLQNFAFGNIRMVSSILIIVELEMTS
jgi:hypothetical protein